MQSLSMAKGARTAGARGVGDVGGSISSEHLRPTQSASTERSARLVEELRRRLALPLVRHWP